MMAADAKRFRENMEGKAGVAFPCLSTRDGNGLSGAALADGWSQCLDGFVGGCGENFGR